MNADGLANRTRGFFDANGNTTTQVQGEQWHVIK